MPSGPSPTVRRVQRLRPLSEEECYLRCYGWRGARTPSRSSRPSRPRGRGAGGARPSGSGSRSRRASKRASPKRHRAPDPRRPQSRTCSLPGSPSSSAGSTPAASRTPRHAHFANPRNDFWRLLARRRVHAAPLDPAEQFELLALGIGVTNAAYRTTPGSGDLRRGDFAGSAERLETARARAAAGRDRVRRQGGLPRAFRERARARPAGAGLGETELFVLPSTSPANAAVPWEERLRWFRALRDARRTEL